MSRNPKFDKLITEWVKTHDDKNSDYSADTDPLSNFRMAETVGLTPLDGVLVRMSDKWSRIGQLRRGKKPKNESLRDSFKDLSIYAMIAVLLLDEQEPSE
jgi:hypothetical protein